MKIPKKLQDIVIAAGSIALFGIAGKVFIMGSARPQQRAYSYVYSLPKREDIINQEESVDHLIYRNISDVNQYVREAARKRIIELNINEFPKGIIGLVYPNQVLIVPYTPDSTKTKYSE
ncbi:MAG: hypothetical protein AABW41_03840 [Nanoarchaeota archaeon]